MCRAIYLYPSWTPRDELTSGPGKPKWGVLDEEVEDHLVVAKSTRANAGTGVSVTLAKKLWVEVAQFNTLLQAWGPLNR